MADDDLTHGEIKRTFDRVEAAQRATNDRVADLAKSMMPVELWAAEHRALREMVEEFRATLSDGLRQQEARSLERRQSLMAKDSDLEQRLNGLHTEFDRKVELLKRELAAERDAERSRATADEKRGTARTANWIAAAIALSAVIGLIVTLVGGGH
jgi:hypothetical protein